MNASPKISIIIPCYNVEEYIPRLIQSLSIQPKSIDSEFIFINDGSTDRTLEILKQFEQQDSRVVLIDKNNRGVSAARNDALKVARGEYVYLVDGDDYITSDALEIIQSCLSNSHFDLLITNLYYYCTYTARLIPYHHGILPREYDVDEFFQICKFFPTSPKNIYKNSIIKKYGLKFNEKLKVGEVYEFTVLFLQRANSIKVINDRIYCYVVRKSSATMKPDINSDLTVLYTLKQLYTNDSFTGYMPFHITAFRMVTSFTYNKYVKCGFNTDEALSLIGTVLRNPLFKRLLSVVAWKKHHALKERMLAIYIVTTSIMGFRLLSSSKKYFIK